MQAFLAWGFNTVEIADYLGVSSKTVRRARAKIRTLGLLMGSALCPQSGQHNVCKVDMSTKQTHRMSTKQTNGNGTEIALARASDPTPISSPVPKNSKTSLTRHRTPRGKSREPWEHAIIKVFNDSLPITRWPAAWAAFDRLKDRARALSPDDPPKALAAMVDLFARITRGEVAGVDRWLRGRPFTPQALDNQFDAVLAIAKERVEASEPQEVVW